MVMLMGLRGTPFLYYGDEIGMPDTDVPAERILDPVGKMFGPRLGRDNERTPMQWSRDDGAGFSAPGVEPWLPYGNFAACNVAEQRDDPSSMLHLDARSHRVASRDRRIFATARTATHPASDDHALDLDAWRAHGRRAESLGRRPSRGRHARHHPHRHRSFTRRRVGHRRATLDAWSGVILER